MARTNIVLDDRLVSEGMALSGARSRRELVDAALRAYLDFLKRKQIRLLRGKVEFFEDYDHRTLRARGTSDDSGR